MKSPRLSDRYVVIDFPQHSLQFLEVHHTTNPEVLEDQWSEHLAGLGFGAESRRLARKLEDYYVRMAPASLAPELATARERRQNLFLALQRAAECERTVVVPGDWLSALKSVPWPSAPAVAAAVRKLKD